MPVKASTNGDGFSVHRKIRETPAVAVHGQVFTRPHIVNFILDLAGYTCDKPLEGMSLLEPGTGCGIFLLTAASRLLARKPASLTYKSLSSCLLGVERDEALVEQTRGALIELLVKGRVRESVAKDLAKAWVLCADFLELRTDQRFEFVVGNPPYVRQEAIPKPLVEDYRSRFSCFYDRAVSYVAHGYWFYVAGCVPTGKDPRAVDAKIIARYDIGISKWAKARRKQAGLANLQYIRHERFFLILATHGKHRFFEDEAQVIRDVRRIPIKFAGYSISFRGGHASVRIEPAEYRMLKAYFIDQAARRSSDALSKEVSQIPFEPYAPIRRQLLNLVRAVNGARKSAGMAPIENSVLRLRRRSVRPFFSQARRGARLDKSITDR